MAPLDFCAKRYQNRVNVCVCVDVFEIFFCLMCVFAVCGLSYVSASPQCFVSLHIFVLTVCVALFVKLDVCKWVCIFYARFSFVLVSLYVNIWKCWCVCVCVCICPCVPVKVLVCVHSAVVVHVFVFWEKMGKGERWWFACVFVGAYVCVCVCMYTVCQQQYKYMFCSARPRLLLQMCKPTIGCHTPVRESEREDLLCFPG